MPTRHQGRQRKHCVRSILGRYLEHSRIFYFENSGGAKPRILAGSADWMPRNFFRRIECVFPIEDHEHRKRIIDILQTYLQDNQQASFLRSSGAYQKTTSKSRSRSRNKALSAQDTFLISTTQKRTKKIKVPQTKYA